MTIYIDSKEQDSFIGTVHPKHDHITVVGWDGLSRRNSAKLYDAHCIECAKDRELFGDGIFKIVKADFKRGYISCNCSDSPRWSLKQYQILINRKCKTFSEKISFVKFVDEKINKSTRIELDCQFHGKFTTSICSFMVANNVCKKCADKTMNDEQFKNRMKIINPNIEILGEYNNTITKIDLNCVICNNKWSTNPRNILMGCGCPNCSPSGFKNSKSAYFYIHYSENWNVIKIGKTNNDPKWRLYCQNKSSAAEFKSLFQFYSESGRFISELERYILSKLRQLYKNPTEKCDGYTEMFINADPSYILDLVQQFKYNNEII